MVAPRKGGDRRRLRTKSGDGNEQGHCSARARSGGRRQQSFCESIYDDRDDLATAQPTRRHLEDRSHPSRPPRRRREWRIWRDAPGFSQRFTGKFSNSGDTIDGRWELCRDEVNWKADLQITYRRDQ
jgi:hypothetical protein